MWLRENQIPCQSEKELEREVLKADIMDTIEAIFDVKDNPKAVEKEVVKLLQHRFERVVNSGSMNKEDLTKYKTDAAEILLGMQQ